MTVEIVNQTKERLSRLLITQSVDITLRYKKRKGDVSVVIVGDAAMTKLNKTFRGKNSVTDILSFAESDSEEPDKNFTGELIIDFKQIKRQAKTFGHAISWELAFIVIHGTLHLVGFEDETEKGRREMEKIGNMLIKKIKV